MLDIYFKVHSNDYKYLFIYLLTSWTLYLKQLFIAFV